MRLIDANALCEFFQERYEYLRNASEKQLPNGHVEVDLEIQCGAIIAKEFLDKAKNAPTINPDDFIPCGRWINAYVEGVHYYRCSECGEYIEAVWTANFIFKNCPNCGACMNLSDTNVGDMDGKENENDRHRSNRHRRGGYPDSGNHLLSGGSRRGREDGQEMSELKPCPFCGSEAVVHVENGVRVICKKCGASTKILVDTYTQGRPTGGAIKTVVNAWNRRATDEQPHN